MEPAQWMRFHPFVATLEPWSLGLRRVRGPEVGLGNRGSRRARVPHQRAYASRPNPYRRRDAVPNSSRLLRNSELERHA